MTTAQESTILALLGTDPNGFKPIEIQKLMFVFSMEEEPSPSYSFMPFIFGGYSFNLSRDIHALADRCLITEEEINGEKRWNLTEMGRIHAFAIREKSKRIVSFRRRYALRGDSLTADTYRRYPYWAINSMIAETILDGDTAALAAIKAAKPKTSLSLATIGYEGRSLEEYFNILIRNGIDTLCDVRRNPISRKYGFSKVTLEKACKGTGISYCHFPQLGIPSHERERLECQSDYDALFERYRRTTLAQETDTIAVLARRIAEGAHVALTCFERNPSQCHRTQVADAVARMLNETYVAL